jgi:hypothetical protein
MLVEAAQPSFILCFQRSAVNREASAGSITKVRGAL